MTQSIQMRRWMLAAAIVGVVWVPTQALAQYQTGNNGHARDASNQVGSGGYNGGQGQGQKQSGNPAAQKGGNGNDLVDDNVTGNRGFRGIIPYRDPLAFTGTIQAEPSQALEQRAGVTTTSGVFSQQVFYKDNRGVAPPINFQSAGYTGGYIPGPTPSRQQGDQRLGEIYLDAPIEALPPIGASFGAGQVDPTVATTPTFLSASPLYGVREFSVGNDANAFQASNNVYGNTRSINGLSDDDILRLRRDLNRNLLSPDNTGSNTQTGQPNNPAGTGNGQPPANGLTPTPLNSALPNGVLLPQDLSTQDAVRNGLTAPTAGNMSTGQSSRETLPPLPPAVAQSPQYAAMRQQLEKYQAAHPENDEEAHRLFLEALKARRAMDQGTPSPLNPATPNPAGGLHQPITGISTSGNVTPVKVGPIGEAIRAPGLSDLLKQGEALARQQKFNDAISKFRDARAVAPNQPLIAVELANSELGAGYYKEAEQDLRAAFTADPALLMGQYDLKLLIGDDRLQVLIGDLKHIGATTTNPTPVFLLAYLSYNTGETKKAVEYLDLADKRSGGTDSLIESLQKHWALSVQTPTTGPSENK